MKTGRYYRVRKIGENATSVKLVCLGVMPGKVLRVIRKAPLGGGYYVSCDDKRFGISAQELARLDLIEVSVDEKSLN